MFNSPTRPGFSKLPRPMSNRYKEKMSAPNNAYYVLTVAHAGLPNSVLFNPTADTWLATKDTGDLTEGVNLYYTDARVGTYGDANYVQLTNFSTLWDADFAAEDTDGLSEGATNLYYTNARVLNVALALDGSNANSNIDIDTYDFTTTGTGDFGTGIIQGELIVNEGMSDHTGLVLKSNDADAGPGRLSGEISWWPNNSGVSAWNWIDLNNNFVFNDSIQLSSGDYGNAYINCTDGSAMFATGNFKIASDGDTLIGGGLVISGVELEVRNEGTTNLLIHNRSDVIGQGAILSFPIATSSNPIHLIKGSRSADIEVIKSAGHSMDMRFWCSTGAASALVMFLDGNTGAMVFPDNKHIQMGAGLTDLELYSDGINGIIDVATTLRLGNNITNYTEIKADGEINLHGTARVERHLLVDPTRFKMPAANFPGESFEGIFYTLDFNKTTEESAYCVEHIPFRWDSGVDIEVEVDWMHTGADAGTVVWGLEYKSITTGETFAPPTVTITHTTAAGTSANVLIRTTFTSKILAANLASHDIMACRFYRKAGDVADTLDEDARVTNVCFHFIQNKLGQAT